MNKSSLLFEVKSPLKETIYNWGLNNISDHDIFPDLARSDDLHCTILYGIKEEDPYHIEKVLVGEPSFEVTLGDISIFDNELFDVLKIDVHSKDLYQLYNIASRSITHKSSYKNFSPHITIAFMKKQKGKQVLNKINKKEFFGTKYKVNKLCFNRNDKKRFINLVD